MVRLVYDALALASGLTPSPRGLGGLRGPAVQLVYSGHEGGRAAEDRLAKSGFRSIITWAGEQIDVVAAKRDMPIASEPDGAEQSACAL